MKKLTWWFRIVGAFYLFLAVVNMYGTFVDSSFFGQAIPYRLGENALRAFVDGWSPFAFEILGIATFMLWASRDPRKYLGAVWLLVWLELLHGVVDDVYLIAKGYSAAEYIAFIVVHFIIIGTGVMFARQASAETANPSNP
ncbi:MAG: BphX family protein [Chloroflexi bacterium]|nr:BphX family protein [Chloroflexota bacterium]